jgi:hypothetical protein
MNIKHLFYLPVMVYSAHTMATQPILKENGIACFSERYFDQEVRAENNNDKMSLAYLFKKGHCIMAKQDFPASILDRSKFGKLKIRVYSGDDAFELWTYSEHVSQ